jgi:hypothetical protein
MGDAYHHGSAAQYVEVDEDVVRIVDENLIDQNRYLVAVVGPPGAGKSTTCNTLYHIAFGSTDSFFEPSASPTSFTKGLWLLSSEARLKLPANINWECVDMEGFQVDLMSSWKMAMVLCVLSGTRGADILSPMDVYYFYIRFKLFVALFVFDLHWIYSSLVFLLFSLFSFLSL